MPVEPPERALPGQAGRGRVEDGRAGVAVEAVIGVGVPVDRGRRAERAGRRAQRLSCGRELGLSRRMVELAVPVEDRLRALYDGADYPSWERVQSCFGVRWNYFSVNTPQVLQTISARLYTREQAKATGKPPQVIEKIVTGKMEKYYEENCLYEQHFIKDESMTVGEMVSQMIHKLGENISIRRYVRFKVGESAAAPADESPAAVAAN